MTVKNITVNEKTYDITVDETSYNITVSMVGTQGATGAAGGDVLFANSFYVNYANGSNSNSGSATSPFKTIVYAMSQITTNSAVNPYTIYISAGNQIESADVLLKPYVSIKGEGQPTQIDLSGFSIKPAAAISGGSINYLSGFDIVGDINWDLQAIGGTSDVQLKLDHVNKTGTTTIKGRVSSDTFWDFNSVSAGYIIVDSAVFASEFLFMYGDINITDSLAMGNQSTLINVVLFNVTTDNTSLNLFDVTIVGTITTTGAVNITSAQGLPSAANRIFSIGTTVTELTDATAVAYSPSNVSFWETIPSQTGQALDVLAETKATITQAAAYAYYLG